MKFIIIYISLFFSILPTFMYGQCLTNGNFSNACSTTVKAENSCPTWTDDCGDSWVRSHGTPNFGTYTYPEKGQTKTGYYAFMYSGSSTTGEGMFTNYNFQAHHTYTLSLDLSVSVDAGQEKNCWVLIYAANGLVQGDLTKNFCENTIPGLTTKFGIGKYEGSGTNDWTTMSFSFISDADYTQLWIYPVLRKGLQANLSVKNINLCPSCDGEINYDVGTVPSGISKAAKIDAGSNNIFGVVNINPNADTYLMASQEINLIPNFDISPSTGSFSAEIYECTQPPARIETGASKPILSVKPAAVDEHKDLNIYPTIGTGQINITGDLTSLENVELAVYDLTGRMIVQLPKKSYAGKATINLSNLNNGTYLFLIKQKNNSITKKIIIQK